MKKGGKNANYDFKKQKEPAKPMGQGGFANLPDKAMMMAFDGNPSYRDGIVNSFSCNVSEVSGIDENER
jgi:hypothetical protein